MDREGSEERSGRDKAIPGMSSKQLPQETFLKWIKDKLYVNKEAACLKRNNARRIKVD